MDNTYMMFDYKAYLLFFTINLKLSTIKFTALKRFKNSFLNHYSVKLKPILRFSYLTSKQKRVLLLNTMLCHFALQLYCF